ncbi:MAG: GNAT family N-acetyltransferase [Alphaproteobacteria bacterium]|nr:GNAT family N-acetyltransferase [Alphaproteobacteria bacterium]
MGDRFDGPSLTVTEADIIGFARQWDPQPFHTDPTAAGDSVFGRLVASGWHTAAITMRLMVQSGVFAGPGMVGVEVTDLRWPVATLPGDTLTVHAEVVSARASSSKPDRGVLAMRYTTTNQRGEIAQSFLATQIVLRRPRSQDTVIRRATPADLPAIETLLRAAFEPYIERIGLRPQPLLSDHASVVDSGHGWVAEVQGMIGGYSVLLPAESHLQLDVLAVLPLLHGRGVGSLMLKFAEAEAIRLGFGTVRLYTHARMEEAAALYRRRGFVETHRQIDRGYDRIHMAKLLDTE